MRARTGTRSAPHRAAAAVALLLAASLTGCAHQNANQPGGTPTVVASVGAVVPFVAAPSRMVAVAPVPGRHGRSCQDAGAAVARQPPASRARPSGAPPRRFTPPVALSAHPIPAAPSASDVDAERRRRVLERAASATPIPRRGAVPAEAVAAAERCVQSLRPEFTLLTVGETRPPSATHVEATLISAGLSRVLVRVGAQGLVFAGWTGEVCVFGGFRGATATWSIGPPARDGNCRP